MSGERRVSSVSKNRIHSSYITRATRARSSDSVGKVEPVDRIKNQLTNTSANFLIASDYFYNNLKELKEEYKKFYHDQNKLEKAIKEMEEDDGKLLEHIKELIEKYNIAIVSLKDLDRVLNTNHKGHIEKIINTFKPALGNIGIDVDKTYKISMNQDIFIKKIEKSKDPIGFLFEPMKGMVVQLYKGFKNIQYPTDQIDNDEYMDIKKSDFSGLILDEKS